MRTNRALPAVVEAEDAGLGGQGVEDEPAGMAPAADHAVLSSLGEVAVAQPRFEVVECAARNDLDDDVDVLGRADGRCTRVSDPQRHGRPADEDYLVEQRAKRVGH